MSNLKNTRSRLLGAVLIATCGLYFLLISIVLIRHHEISLGKSIFAKISLVLEILLLLFIGIATWLGEVPLVMGLLLGSVLAIDTCAPITHCIALLYANVALSTCLVLYASHLYWREARKGRS
jgi:hypothetical protein